MFPLDYLLNYLKTLDEVSLCELLEISTEDLLKAFHSRIIERQEQLEEEVEMIQLDDREITDERFSGETTNGGVADLGSTSSWDDA